MQAFVRLLRRAFRQQHTATFPVGSTIPAHPGSRLNLSRRSTRRYQANDYEVLPKALYRNQGAKFRPVDAGQVAVGRGAPARAGEVPCIARSMARESDEHRWRDGSRREAAHATVFLKKDEMKGIEDVGYRLVRS